VLRSRLLVNATVDPDEAAARLPHGLRPHVTPVGTVVGCCLLDIVELRPQRLPARLGTKQRAAAHRISVEWEDDTGDTVVGVWVPGRRTDARLAAALGGRWFPGVHRPAAVHLDSSAGRVAWRVDDADDFFVDVVGVAGAAVGGEVRDVVAETCLTAAVGLSADHRGGLEAARMDPDVCRARAVSIEHLASRFIAGFSTAERAPSYLMENVAVTWSPAAAPRLAETLVR
jgi:hypothetical protein